VIAIRAAVAADVPRLQAIFRDAAWSNVDDRPLFGEHPEFLDWSGDPATEGRTRVAEIGDEVVGFVSIIEHGDVVEVEDLFVDPTWMRRGVATALMNDSSRVPATRTRLASWSTRTSTRSTFTGPPALRSRPKSRSSTAPRSA
jgi:GNAT superfamily N-acetyltransferase